MDNNLNVKLYLPKNEGVSPLKTQVYEEELREINEKFPMEENQINIKATYIAPNDHSIEVGFFLRNTLNNNISLENLNLCLKNNSGEIVLSQIFNMKSMGEIPANSGIPMTVSFNKGLEFDFNEAENYSIHFANASEMRSFFSVNAEIENLPNNLSYDAEREILDFSENLQTLRANEISISVFKLTDSIQGGIDITLLLRNGYEKEIKLEELPLTILNFNNTIIGRQVFKKEEGLSVISPRKSKLIKLHFEASKLYTNIYDLSRCKILFK